MFEDWQLALLAAARTATLGTIAADGRPHLVPVCYALVEGTIVIAIDEKPKRAGTLARLRNLARDPRASVLVQHYAEDWTALAWVRCEGQADVLARGDEWPAALAALRDRYPRYEAMALERLPLVRLPVARVVSWRWMDG
ncbi:MAG: TIGR03668 family PPOX class F420-dependent oxidoreductase [Dehalococcoidia bacterium]